jgi:hypothetical protein
MHDTQIFYQQANWCYQLAWQCFDLEVAHELNRKGNELTAKARDGPAPDQSALVVRLETGRSQ